MNPLKILGLAAVAAAALLALVGAGSAAATVLCKNNTGTSGCSETYGSGQVLEASLSETTTLETTGGTVLDTCTGGTLKAKTTNAGGTSETVKANVETLSWTGCTKTTDTIKNGSLEIHWISGTDNGTLTAASSEWTVNTIFGTCTYGFGTSTDLGTISGGNPAKLSVAAILAKTAGGFGCPSEARWTASYSFTVPKPLYVASAGGGGGGGATATSLTTSLSGEEKSGEEITVNEGSKVKDTATLSGTNASKATGTVKYKVYADKECKELVTSAGEVTVTSGSVPASEEKELEAGRVYYWQAEYGGDSNNLSSKSTCGKEVLTVLAGTSLSTSLSGEEKSGEEITISEGSKAKDTATLSGTKSSTSTGKVKFKVYKDKECKELATEAGEGSLSEGKASSEEKTLEAGVVYYWQAEYPGDSLHQASTGTCGKEVLTVKAETTLSATLAAGEATGEVIEVEEETAVTDTAALSGTKSSTATGKVEYSIYADGECKELVTEAGEMTVSEGEVPASEPMTLEPGAYFWQARYSGDATHNPSTSECGSVLEEVKTKNLTIREVGTGAPLTVGSVVEGANTGNLILETKARGEEITIECEENYFSGVVLRNQSGAATLALAKWVFRKGGPEGGCLSTGKIKRDVAITPLLSGTLRMSVFTNARIIQQFSLKVDLGKGPETTCRFKSAAAPVEFENGTALGLTLNATGEHSLKLLANGSNLACEGPLSVFGSFLGLIEGTNKLVVPTW